MSGNPWNKLSTFKEIIWSRKWACQICWCHKTYSFVSTPSTAISGSFLWSSRKLLNVHHWIFMSWALQFAQNLFLRVDSASCWYNWLFQEGFSRKEKLSKFRCIWPLTKEFYICYFTHNRLEYLIVYHISEWKSLTWTSKSIL